MEFNLTYSVVGDDLESTIKEQRKAYMLFCEKGTWHERFAVETDFSWACLGFNSKKLYHRKAKYIDARLGYMTALLNCLLDLTTTPRSLIEFVI